MSVHSVRRVTAIATSRTLPTESTTEPCLNWMFSVSQPRQGRLDVPWVVRTIAWQSLLQSQLLASYALGSDAAYESSLRARSRSGWAAMHSITATGASATSAFVATSAAAEIRVAVLKRNRRVHRCRIRRRLPEGCVCIASLIREFKNIAS